MKKIKLLAYCFLIIGMGICLTGCTIQLDDEDIKTFDKIKNSTNISVNGNLIDTNELISELNTNENILNQNNTNAYVTPSSEPTTTQAEINENNQ